MCTNVLLQEMCLIVCVDLSDNDEVAQGVYASALDEAFVNFEMVELNRC
jgi:hypothetical protein